MSLTMRQRQRLREGRLCITLPQARARMDDAAKFDLAVIVGALCVIGGSIWPQVPYLEDGAILLLCVVAIMTGAWAIWSAIRHAWGRGE